MNASSESGSPSSLEAYPARRLVGLLVMVASTAYLARVDMTIVAPRLMEEFHLSQQQMGEVFSAFLVGYTAFQVPSGWLADRVRTWSLFLGLALCWALVTAATAAIGLRQLGATLAPLPALLLLRGAFGVFAAPTYPAAGRAIAVSLPPHLHGRANGVVLASIGIGSALTPILLGPVSVRWGWRPALLEAAALAALSALVWWAMAPGSITQRSARASVVATSLGNATRKSPLQNATVNWPSPLGQRSFWCLTASYTLQGYVGYVFIFWTYLYLAQVRHFDLMKAAWLTTLPWICSLVAIPLGGFLSDLAARRWGATWGRRAVPIPALLLSSALLALGARAETAAVAVASLALSTALVLSTEGPFWASMNQLAGPRSGTAGGVMNFGSNLGGMVSPVLTPWLASRLGWGMALTLTALVAVLSGLLWMGVAIRDSQH